MLLDIIREIIEEAYPSFSASDTLSNSISKEIKDLAKKLFFIRQSLCKIDLSLDPELSIELFHAMHPILP